MPTPSHPIKATSAAKRFCLLPNKCSFNEQRDGMTDETGGDLNEAMATSLASA